MAPLERGGTHPI